MALISKVSKIVKLIHFDVQVKAEYEGHIYQARSLNEFRSLLMSYFRAGSDKGNLEYKNLRVQLEDNEKKALAGFDAFFNRRAQRIFCKVEIGWLKEKKWFVKKIDVHSCRPAA